MEVFFNKLAERMYKENSLSDITWALCYENASFKYLFINYCFPNIKNIKIIEFDREFKKQKSRPDFHFYDENGGEYLIEIKIYDRNQHFLQYSKSFPMANKSFIANYNLNEKINNFSILTWRGFILDLEKGINENKLLNNDLIIGYLKYLKIVTNFYEEKTMNFSNLNSLVTFYNIVINIINDKFHEKVKMDNRARGIGSEHYGFFLTNKKKNIKYFYFWVGLMFHNDNIELGFQIQSCHNRNLIKEGKYFILRDNNEYAIMKKQYFNKLCDQSISVKKQQEIIENYLEEILNYLI